MINIPAAMLEQLHLQLGDSINMSVAEGKLIIEPKTKPSYTLAELMAQCDLSQDISTEEQQWLDDSHLGNEEI